jgi:glycosyltransferase involved in cell wall biosynthesis
VKIRSAAIYNFSIHCFRYFCKPLKAMRVAVNTRFWSNDYSEGYGNFTREICSRLARNHPGDTFIFISDKAFVNRENLPANVIPVIVKPVARHPLLWKYWYDVLIPAVLKKYKADVFLTLYGFCSLRTKVPQCLVIHDLAFLHFPHFIPALHRWYYQRFTPSMIRKARQIITVSNYSEHDIIVHYPHAAGKLAVVYNAASDHFQQLESTEKEKIKLKYTEGKEFFICIGAVHPRKNLINLLKAFSWFKKRQQTNMQLLIAGRLAWHYDDFLEKLETFRFKKDVKLLGYVPAPELPGLVASAYGLVYPSLFEGFGLPLLEAMQCGVPVISSNGGAMPEIAADVALYCDPDNAEEMGQQMAQLYKDENLREMLIQRGFTRARNFSWDDAAEKVWATLMKTVS